MKRETIYTEQAPEAIGPYSQGIKAGNFLFVSGQIPIDPLTGDIVIGDVQKETMQVLENLKAIVEAAGASLQDIAKTTIFIKDMNQFTLINEIYSKYFPNNPPARSCIEVSKLPKDVSLEIEAIAICTENH